MRRPPTSAISHELVRTLTAARRGWWQRALERGLIHAFLVLGIALTVSWPVRLVLDLPGTPWATTGIPLLTNATVSLLVLAFCTSLAVQARRAPSLLAIARHADHALAQRQRISTAFEVLMMHGATPPSIIERRLLAEVVQALPNLPIRSVTARPIPRGTRSLTLASVVAASLAFAVPVPHLPDRTTITTSGPITAPANLLPTTVEETMALAERIAEQLAEEPIAERDPYLRAVAEGFAELALNLREDTIEVAELEQAVNDLLTNLDRAVERTGGSLEQAVQDVMPEGIDRGRGEDSNATVPSFGSMTEEAEESAATGDMAAPAAPGRSADTNERSALERLSDALERRAEERAANAAAGGTESFGQDGSNPYGDQVNVIREGSTEGTPGADPLLRAEGEGAGQAAGAAQQSSDAAGDAAGGGSAALDGPTNDFQSPEADVNVTPLEANEREGGRTIELTIAPTASETAERGLTTDPAIRAFDRSDEAALPASSLGWTYRDVVQRYFLPASSSATPVAP